MAMKRMWSKGQITKSVQEVIESGQVENAKPVYFHPVFLVYRAASKFIPDQSGDLYLTLTILNNSSEPFTKASFLEWINKLEEQTSAYITGVSFYCKTASGYIYDAIIEWNSSDWHVICYDSVGTSYGAASAGGKITWSNLDESVLRDGINKIN